jgi:hypothetical protein
MPGTSDKKMEGTVSVLVTGTGQELHHDDEGDASQICDVVY